jgi:hypothetical protein
MAKRQETITIPISLARLLIAEPEDMKNPDDYQNIQEVAKASLKLLMSVK